VIICSSDIGLFFPVARPRDMHGWIIDVEEIR